MIPDRAVARHARRDLLAASDEAQPDRYGRERSGDERRRGAGIRPRHELDVPRRSNVQNHERVGRCRGRPQHDPRLRVGVRVLHAGDPRDDLAVAFEIRRREVERVGRTPDVGAGALHGEDPRRVRRRPGDADGADVPVAPEGRGQCARRRRWRGASQGRAVDLEAPQRIAPLRAAVIAEHPHEAPGRL